MKFIRVIELESGRVVGYDDETKKISLGHPPGWSDIEADVIRMIIHGVLIDELKTDTLKKVNDKYGELAEFYAEGILSGLTVTLPYQLKKGSEGVSKCKL